MPRCQAGLDGMSGGLLADVATFESPGSSKRPPKPCSSETPINSLDTKVYLDGIIPLFYLYPLYPR